MVRTKKKFLPQTFNNRGTRHPEHRMVPDVGGQTAACGIQSKTEFFKCHKQNSGPAGPLICDLEKKMKSGKYELNWKAGC